MDVMLEGWVTIEEINARGERRIVEQGPNGITRRGAAWIMSMAITGANAYDNGLSSASTNPFAYLLVTDSTTPFSTTEDSFTGTVIVYFQSLSSGSTANLPSPPGMQIRRHSYNVAAGVGTGVWGSIGFATINVSPIYLATRYVLSTPYTKDASTGATITYDLRLSYT